jgi:hypothetical protein
MVTAFGEEYLEVDEGLAVLMIPMILSYKEAYLGNVGLATNYEYYSNQILNVYNRSKSMVEHTNLHTGFSLSGSM